MDLWAVWLESDARVRAVCVGCGRAVHGRLRDWVRGRDLGSLDALRSALRCRACGARRPRVQCWREVGEKGSFVQGVP